MGWTGAILGGVAGSLIGGPLRFYTAIIGSLIGSHIEDRMKAERQRQTGFGPREDAARIFCASAAAMLAKMAKADGRITKDEIASVERAFARLGFSAAMREEAIRIFRQAKDNARSIYDYAADFAQIVATVELRVIFYELLWDLACADGKVTAHEQSILRHMPQYLRISGGYYHLFAHEYLHASQASDGSGARTGGAGAYVPPRDELEDAYRQLGVAPSATDAEVKKAYHAMAKKYHPDTLRAQGLPEAMVGRATERMSKINAAWAAIREKRRI